MSTDKLRWSELEPWQRGAVVVGGAVELALTAIATRDLRRREASQVRGPKALWFAALAIQPFGPIGYLLLGRR
jgi:Phospholipase_D-nuclease N-terminal